MADVGPTTRTWVYERDNGCRFAESGEESCGTHRDLTLHHVLARRHGGGNQTDNLVTLCREHHARIEQDTALRSGLHRLWFEEGLVRERSARLSDGLKRRKPTREERLSQAFKDADRRLRVGFVRV